MKFHVVNGFDVNGFLINLYWYKNRLSRRTSFFAMTYILNKSLLLNQQIKEHVKDFKITKSNGNIEQKSYVRQGW